MMKTKTKADILEAQKRICKKANDKKWKERIKNLIDRAEAMYQLDPRKFQKFIDVERKHL